MEAAQGAASTAAPALDGTFRVDSLATSALAAQVTSSFAAHSQPAAASAQSSNASSARYYITAPAQPRCAAVYHEFGQRIERAAANLAALRKMRKLASDLQAERPEDTVMSDNNGNGEDTDTGDYGESGQDFNGDDDDDGGGGDDKDGVHFHSNNDDDEHCNADAVYTVSAVLAIISTTAYVADVEISASTPILLPTLVSQPLLVRAVLVGPQVLFFLPSIGEMKLLPNGILHIAVTYCISPIYSLLRFPRLPLCGAHVHSRDLRMV